MKKNDYKNEYTILISVINNKVNAAFVEDCEEGYSYLRDADVTSLQLDDYPSLLSYLQCTGYNLELKYSHLSGITKSSIFFRKREGGYKESSYKKVVYSSEGNDSLSYLNEVLSILIENNEEKSL